MICVSLADLSYEELLSALEAEDFAEIRLDQLSLTSAQVSHIFSTHARLIATCRPGNEDDSQRVQWLKKAIEAGAAYVDIEVESSNELINDMVEFAHAHGCEVIVSYHNFETTPYISELQKIVNICFEDGADIAKIVTKVNNNADRARILSLYTEDKRMVAFGMGDKGKLTRLLAPLMGAEYTYASVGAGKEVAPGQIDKASMLEMIEYLKTIEAPDL